MKNETELSYEDANSLQLEILNDANSFSDLSS